MFINTFPALRSFCLSVRLSFRLFGCCFIHSLTHPLSDRFFLSLSPFVHPRDLISVFLNRSEASISAVAQVFYIPPSFRLADRSIRGWGPTLQAMVLARMFALVRLICHSLLFCTDTPYKILDVATQACIIFLRSCFFTLKALWYILSSIS